jgi:hypothetical protein
MAADLAVRERIPNIVGLVGSDIALTENDEATVSICELADVTAQDTEHQSCRTYSNRLNLRGWLLMDKHVLSPELFGGLIAGITKSEEWIEDEW